jgi:hypothetical protein
MPLQIARTILTLLAVASLLGGCYSPRGPTDLVGTYRSDDSHYTEVLVLKADGTYEEALTIKALPLTETQVTVQPGDIGQTKKNAGHWSLRKEGLHSYAYLENAMIWEDYDKTVTKPVLTFGEKRNWELDIQYSYSGKLIGLYWVPDHSPCLWKEGIRQ